jgi:hypothetical protein
MASSPVIPAWQAGMVAQSIALSIPSNKDVALALARMGIRIFPCTAKKRPVFEGWEASATADISNIGAWRDAYLPAIPPGIIGLVVIDCDRKPGNPDGVKAFDDLCSANAIDLQDAFVVSTPSGGRHYYFRTETPSPYGNSTGTLPEGIDVRGSGGLVIAPGATLPDGRGYRILSGTWNAIPELPAALAAFLKEKTTFGPSVPLPEGHAPEERDRAWALAALEGEFQKVAATTEPGRNDQLNKSACTMGGHVANGSIDVEQVWTRLLAATHENGSVRDWGEAAQHKTIRSGMSKGVQHPFPLKSVEAARLSTAVDISAVYSEPPRPLRRRTEGGNQFPLHALGNTLQWAADAIADKIQCPVGMAAMSVLGAASLVVQSHGDVVLPASGQTKPLSLFLVSIGESGERKSAADGEALRAVRLREKELTEVHDKELASYRNNHDAWEAARARILKGKAEHPLEIAGQLARIGLEPVAPLTPILTCPEPTFEGLCNLYQTGWPGLGLFSDEGGQFVGGHALSVDSRLRTIAGLSTLWDGAAIKRVRAAKDGSYVLPGRRLAMHLMLQPGVAAGLLSDPILKDQGFLSRLLVSHPPSTTGTRLQRPVKQHTQEWLDFYTNRLLTMLQQHPATVEGKPSELSPRALRFEPAAQQAWTAYADSVEKQIGAGGKYESIMRFANKLPEHASRIAGVLTLFDDLSSPYLTVDAFSRGVEIANHFADEALRLFDAGMVTPEISVAESLLDWLLAKWTEPYIGLSSIYQRGPNAIRDAKAAKAAVSTLVEHGWLLKAPAGTMVGGRAVKEAWQIIRLAN